MLSSQPNPSVVGVPKSPTSFALGTPPVPSGSSASGSVDYRLELLKFPHSVLGTEVLGAPGKSLLATFNIARTLRTNSSISSATRKARDSVPLKVGGNSSPRNATMTRCTSTVDSATASEEVSTTLNLSQHPKNPITPLLTTRIALRPDTRRPNRLHGVNR